MQKVCYIIIMSKTRNQQPTREDIFRQKAETYTVCFSSTCPNREHCLRSLLRAYTPHDKLVCTSINLNHPMTQQTDCPMYRNDQTVRMAQGFMDIFYDVPGHLEVSIKKRHLLRCAWPSRGEHQEAPYRHLWPQALLRVSEWREGDHS